jgi:hypothetical protein
VDRYRDDAVKWHVDDQKVLHIVGRTGNVGTYAPGCWHSVHYSE